MNTEKLYKELATVVNRAGGAVPVVEIPEMFDLLKALVNEEEAELAIKLPGNPGTAQAMSVQTGISREDIAQKLESMTTKGFLHARRNSSGDFEYSVLPLLPGIFEIQFLRGTKTDRDYQVAKTFKAYFDVINDLRDSLEESQPPPETPFFRILPIEEEVQVGKTVLPYAQLSRYLEKTDTIAVSTCFCRHFAVLIDENDRCGASHDNCMTLGDAAVFISERHNGRLIDKEEAQQIIKQAEEQGLVHCSANTSEELEFICNCCSCHCGILSMAKSVSPVSAALTSGYFAQVDDAFCTACETCLERCPIDAISINGVALIDHSQCIGCALCVSSCPDEAIELLVQPDNKIPPATRDHLDKAMSDQN